MRTSAMQRSQIFARGSRVSVEDGSVTLDGDATSSSGWPARVCHACAHRCRCDACQGAGIAAGRAATGREVLARALAEPQRIPCGPGEPYRPTSAEIVLGRQDVLLRDPSGTVAKRASTAGDLSRHANGGYYIYLPGDPLTRRPRRSCSASSRTTPRITRSCKRRGLRGPCPRPRASSTHTRARSPGSSPLWRPTQKQPRIPREPPRSTSKRRRSARRPTSSFRTRTPPGLRDPP